MRSFTPQLQLETLFVLDADGRIQCTREPHPTHGPAFALIRDKRACAWAVHADLSSYLVTELCALARHEAPTTVISDPPRYAEAYIALLGGRVESGPVFTFPPIFPVPNEATVITDLSELSHHFHGWTAVEMPERSPIVALSRDGHAVSVCFCARRSGFAAEAGVETAGAYRGRGYGALVTATWAGLVRESRRLPLYSTSWANIASLSVARKLALLPRAADWSIYEAADQTSH